MVLIRSKTKTNVVIYYQITWETATIFTTTTNATTIVTFPSVTKITFFYSICYLVKVEKLTKLLKKATFNAFFFYQKVKITLAFPNGR